VNVVPCSQFVVLVSIRAKRRCGHNDYPVLTVSLSSTALQAFRISLARLEGANVSHPLGAKTMRSGATFAPYDRARTDPEVAVAVG